MCQPAQTKRVDHVAALESAQLSEPSIRLRALSKIRIRAILMGEAPALCPSATALDGARGHRSKLDADHALEDRISPQRVHSAPLIFVHILDILCTFRERFAQTIASAHHLRRGGPATMEGNRS